MEGFWYQCAQFWSAINTDWRCLGENQWWEQYLLCLYYSTLIDWMLLRIVSSFYGDVCQVVFYVCKSYYQIFASYVWFIWHFDGQLKYRFSILHENKTWLLLNTTKDIFIRFFQRNQCKFENSWSPSRLYFVRANNLNWSNFFRFTRTRLLLQYIDSNYLNVSRR